MSHPYARYTTVFVCLHLYITSLYDTVERARTYCYDIIIIIIIGIVHVYMADVTIAYFTNGCRRRIKL